MGTKKRTKSARMSYLGGLWIDHKTKQSVSPDGKRKPLTQSELKEMKRRERIKKRRK